MWLKAFTSVQVKSVFIDGEGHWQRTFDFSLVGHGISNHLLERVEAQSCQTTIALQGYLEKYQAECPKNGKTIAERIIEHCLGYLLNGDCPDLCLLDDDEEVTIDLKHLYQTEVQPQSRQLTVKCRDIDFLVTHLRVFAGEFSQHTIHLCANGRDVEHLTLAAYIPYVPAKFKAADGKLFVYKAYVCSPFLDQRVNAERSAFNFARKGELQSQHEPTDDEIAKVVVEAAAIELSPLLTEVEEKIKARIETLVGSRFPEYRAILKHVDSHLQEFRESADDSEILAKLNEIQFKEDLDARSESKKLLSEQDEGVKRSVKYQKLQALYVERASEIAQTRLAQCVIHRKIILDLLDDQVSLAEDGKYPKEERIHELIFPMRKTSDDIPWDRQNLWIIDERLAYHRFLASDKPIKTFSSNPEAKDEPDLFILNHPGVFGCTTETPLNSAVVVEFKRAERENFKENPVLQAYRYVRKIRGHEVRDLRGRTVPIHPEAVFYCYIIADMTPELRAMAEENGLDPASDGLGYFGFNRNFRAYVEIISYEKLLKDSRGRNKELFAALKIES